MELTAGADGQPVTRPMCLNLEHYFARSHAGPLVPRYQAPVRTEWVADGMRGAVRIMVGPIEAWQVRATITYRLRPERVIEARYDFAFDADYAGFEAFVSNYFRAPAAPYVHLGEGWVQPAIGADEHRFWVRGPREAENARVVYPDAFRRVQLTAAIDPAPYRHPIMVTPVARSRWSVVTIADPEGCASLSANRRWNAHDFSLVGRDVARGQTVTCRAWMAYVRLEVLDEAVMLYRRLTGE